MLKKIITLGIFCTLVLMLTLSAAKAKAQEWGDSTVFSVAVESIGLYTTPDIQSDPVIRIYKNMSFSPDESIIDGGYRWFHVWNKYWLSAIEPSGQVNVEAVDTVDESHPIDLYGIMDQPHRFAVKMVKYPGAEGRMETYEKTDDGYHLRNIYEIYYRKDGPKARYGDLKSPGGNVIRYMYRTTKSGMNGRDSSGETFGVYKISYPMPHDALPHLIAGRITAGQYNKIPAINYKGEDENRMLIPHPHSYMGADIVLHTKRRGSLGCVTIENEEMGYFYNEDIVTENDRELIPLVIYDEDVVAPPIGELF